MRAKLWHAGVLAAALATSFAVAPSSPASAAVPPTQYTPVSLAGMSGMSFMESQADGGVTLGCSGSSTATKRVDATGVVTQDIPNGDPYPNTCAQNAAVGADGTLYTAATNGNGWPRIEAIKNSAVVWTYVIDCRATVMGVVIGTNGNVYVLYGGCGQPTVVGFMPGGNVGAPAIVLNKPVASNVINGGIAAYDSGLALRAQTGLQYVKYDGEVGTPATIANVLSGTYQDYQDATLNGVVPVAIKATASQMQFCSDDWTVGSIAAYSPTGQDWVSSALPACSHVYEMRPTYNGGAIVHYDVPQGEIPGNPRVSYLRALGADGSMLWQYAVPASNSDLTVTSTDYAVDENGNVAIQQQVRHRLDVNGSTYWYRAVRLILLDGFTGNGLDLYELSDNNGTLSSGGYDWFGTRPTVTIGKGTWYVSAMYCDLWSCDPASAKLYAVKVPGLQMDYPRGAALTPVGAKNYVALGDSYSSGEGVPPFVDGTDVTGDRCHRSTRAYAQQLDIPSLGWKLSSVSGRNTFAACAGATTKEIDAANSTNGEPAQDEVLTTATKVVTLTLGGNDVPFKDFVIDCLFIDCSNSTFSHVYFDNVATLGDKLQQAYGTINTKAPNARVYVFGYPQLLPAQGCSQTDDWMAAFGAPVAAAHSGNAVAIDTVVAIGRKGGISDRDIYGVIAAGMFEFNSDEVATARTLVSQLDQAIQTAVNGMGRAWISYVDPLSPGSPFIGHELCTAEPFFNGLDGTNIPYSYHPNLNGQVAYRQLLLQQF